MEIKPSPVLNTYFAEMKYREKLNEKLNCKETEKIAEMETELFLLNENLKKSIQTQKKQLEDSLSLLPIEFVKTFCVSLENDWAISPHEAKVIEAHFSTNNLEQFKVNLRTIAYHKNHGENYADVCMQFKVLDAQVFKLPNAKNKNFSVANLGKYLKDKTLYALEIVPTDTQIIILRMITYNKKNMADCLDLNIQNLTVNYKLQEFS